MGAMASILLVDDDGAVTAALQLLFERLGYRVLTASNGKIAFALIQLEHPDIIVTDWNMPVMDGMEFCRRLRKGPATVGIPVLLVSSCAPPPALTLWDAFLRKPVSFDQLEDAVRTLLASPAGRPDFHRAREPEPGSDADAFPSVIVPEVPDSEAASYIPEPGAEPPMLQ
jgi:CheY-like chemotaxis protein